MNTIECPYCENEFELTTDEGQYYEQDGRNQAECPKCEKSFMVNSSCYWSFEAEKADCLNDGKHKWKQQSGAPREHFHGRFECEDCGEEEHRDEEGRKKLLAELYK